MEIVGKKHDHNSIITAATITRGKRFITGTSSCSYLIQEANPSFPTFIWAVLLTFLLIFLTNLSFLQ